MDNVELVWSDATAEVHRFVVGPIENNVYVVRCRASGEATLIDAANEHDRLLRVATRLGVTSVLKPTATETTSEPSSRLAPPESTSGCAVRMLACCPVTI